MSLDLITDICDGCHILKPIQNKTHWLCSDCVFKKGHEGKTREEVYRERHNKRTANKTKITQVVEFMPKENIVSALKKTFTINKVSNKRAEKEKELKEVYKRIDATREKCCEACGRYDRPLSHSHLLSRANRPDLMCDENNIRLHCFGNTGGPEKTCHEKWSDFNPEEIINMLDLNENMQYISEVDNKVYVKMMMKLEAYGADG